MCPKAGAGFPVEDRRAAGAVVCWPGGKRGPLSPRTDVPLSLPTSLYLRRWSSTVMGAWGSHRLFLDQGKPDAHQIEGNFTSARCNFSVGNYESLTEPLRISTFVWKLFGKSWSNNIIVSMYPKLWQDKTLAKFLIFRGASSTWSYWPVPYLPFLLKMKTIAFTRSIFQNEFLILIFLLNQDPCCAC